MKDGQPKRRRWDRYAVKIRTKVTFSRNGETTSLYGEAGDMSQGGLRLFLPRDVEPGITLRLDFHLPYNSRPTSIRGVIRNRSGFFYGVEFAGVTKLQGETIVQACKALELMQ